MLDPISILLTRSGLSLALAQLSSLCEGVKVKTQPRNTCPWYRNGNLQLEETHMVVCSLGRTTFCCHHNKSSFIVNRMSHLLVDWLYVHRSTMKQRKIPKKRRKHGLRFVWHLVNNIRMNVKLKYHTFGAVRVPCLQ